MCFLYQDKRTYQYITCRGQVFVTSLYWFGCLHSCQQKNVHLSCHCEVRQSFEDIERYGGSSLAMTLVIHFRGVVRWWCFCLTIRVLQHGFPNVATIRVFPNCFYLFSQTASQTMTCQFQYPFRRKDGPGSWGLWVQWCHPTSNVPHWYFQGVPYYVASTISTVLPLHYLGLPPHELYPALKWCVVYFQGIHMI